MDYPTPASLFSSKSNMLAMAVRLHPHWRWLVRYDMPNYIYCYHYCIIMPSSSIQTNVTLQNFNSYSNYSVQVSLYILHANSPNIHKNCILYGIMHLTSVCLPHYFSTYNMLVNCHGNTLQGVWFASAYQLLMYPTNSAAHEML